MCCAGHAAGSSGRAAGGALLPAPSSGGAARPAGPGKGGLTGSQAAAQLALCNGSSGHVNGLVPVRTGLAWATLGAQHRLLPARHIWQSWKRRMPAHHAILDGNQCVMCSRQAWLLPAWSLSNIMQVEL